MASVPVAVEYDQPVSVQGNSFLSSIRKLYSAYNERRDALGLPYPGTVDKISSEVQRDVFLGGSMFTGLRADITKSLAASPMFQTAHAFSMGSQSLTPYTFIATFGTPKVFLHGTIDNEGSLATRANYRWTDSFVTRTQMNLAAGAGQTVVQIDQDYTGKDFSASLKSLNPSVLDGGLTGIFIGSYLQSVTPGLALGLEAVWQRQAMNTPPEAVLSYVARYKGNDWIASAQLQSESAFNTSYWRRLTDKVEVGADLNIQFQPGMGGRGAMMGGDLRKEGTATIGAKYDFRLSTFRAQADSTGKLSALLEKRVLPFVQVIFAGELDQLKQQAKVGLGVSVEVPNEEIMEQQQEMMASNVRQPPY